MTEVRGVRYDAVALLGLAEGSFPVIERADPFLDEDLRAELGLESRLAREQGGLFYQAVTRADKHLLMTRPYLAEDGEDLEASLFWKAVAALLDEGCLQRMDSETTLALADAGSREEVLFQAVRRKGLPRQYGFLEARWHDLQQARDVLNARRAKEADSPFEGAAGTLSARLAERFGPAHGWSASRLETYGACPFYFYVSQALGLKQREQPEVGLKASQLGSMLHEVLELTYAHAADYEVNTLLDALREQAGAVFAYAPERFGFRASALWEAEQRQYLAVLEETIRAIEEDREWVPYRFEQRFGIKGEPALQIDLGDEAIILRGLVDRIDRRTDGGLRVVDYKTGGSHLAKKDLEEGLRLQLPIYALAARDVLGLGEPVEGFYWHIQGAKAGSLKLAHFAWEALDGPEAAYAVLKFHLRKILNGIRAAQFIPQAPSGGCPDYCPAAQWCWKYESQGW
jgi:ATP-dependent helicase/DNAse subunit B